MIDWGKYPNFTAKEFACKCCGSEGINEKLVAKAQLLRDIHKKPLRVTSGYRCPLHPAEKSKSAPGAHALGLAVDFAVDREEAYEVLYIALSLGFTGIGVQQKGEGRFLHLDIAENHLPRPTIWSY